MGLLILGGSTFSRDSDFEKLSIQGIRGMTERTKEGSTIVSIVLLLRLFLKIAKQKIFFLYMTISKYVVEIKFVISGIMK